MEFDDSIFTNYDFDIAPDTSTPQPPPTQSTELATTIDKDDPPAKVKKLKLDEALLLEPNGIPLLQSQTRYLYFQGKNHEAEDLRKLMTYYTAWASNLFPKYNFTDFSKRVGTHASHRRVREMVNGWQDEYKEKLNVRRNFENELSGKTVDDDDNDVRRRDESSEDDDDTPLYIPFDENSKPKEKTSKKTPKYKPLIKRRIESDNEDDNVTKQPRTITFSDDDDEGETSKPSAKSGREYALAIIAEKRKKRKMAQQKAQQQEEEEEEEEKEVVLEKKRGPMKSVDDMMEEYYGEETQLALDDNELSSLQITSHQQQSTEDIEMEDI
ncbi:replication fork protection component Swi3-domain-containing protein [Helicostylum pulchrum]|nr:replication fork protection component Swi3-domain-containing protein [Helicostylum pulchrum]